MYHLVSVFLVFHLYCFLFFDDLGNLQLRDPKLPSRFGLCLLSVLIGIQNSYLFGQTEIFFSPHGQPVMCRSVACRLNLLSRWTCIHFHLKRADLVSATAGYIYTPISRKGCACLPSCPWFTEKSISTHDLGSTKWEAGQGGGPVGIFQE